MLLYDISLGLISDLVLGRHWNLCVQHVSR